MNRFNPVQRLAYASARNPWRVITVAVVASILASIGLYHIPTYTSRTALLPKEDPTYQRYLRFTQNVGAASDLIVVLEGAPMGAMQAFADELGTALRTDPLISTASARFEVEFLYEHAYLLMPEDRFTQVEQGLNNLAEQGVDATSWGLTASLLESERALARGPSLGGLDIDVPTAKDTLTVVRFVLSEWLRYIHEGRSAKPTTWGALLAQLGNTNAIEGQGYYTSRDGRTMLFMFVRPASTSGEADVIAPLINQVRAVTDRQIAAWQGAGRQTPRYGLTGLPAIEYEEHQAISRDKLLTVATAGLAILLLVIFWFRSLRRVIYVFVPMGLGVLWNTGLTWVTVGHLSVLTSGFTAILFGLGVDYGIFLNSRIMEEFAAGGDDDRATVIARGVAAAFPGLLTAGGATVLIFTSLITSHFTGFANLGVVASAGVALVVVATLVLQPALIALWGPSTKDIAAAKPRPHKTGGWRLPRAASAVLLAVAVVGASAGVWAGFHLGFDYDVLSLLPVDSEAAAYQRRMLATSDFQSDVIVVNAPDLARAKELAVGLRALPSVARVQSASDLVPVDSAERAARARRIGVTVDRLFSRYGTSPITLTPQQFQRIRGLLEPLQSLMEDAEEQAFSAGHKDLIAAFEKIHPLADKLVEALKTDKARANSQLYFRALQADGIKLLRIFQAWQQAVPITIKDLPPVLKDRFVARDGSLVLYVFPARSTFEQGFLDTLLKEVYSVAPNATGFPTTHQVFSHMVVDSYHVSTLLAALVALLWMSLVLRSLRSIALAALPLLVGGTWMLGLLYLIGFKYNYANIIALPLIIGLAVDYGVWFAHRRRELPEADAWQVARVAGRPILLAATTTLAGLGAITLASYRGIATMGQSLTIGLVCCLVAALLIAPALAHLLDKRRS